MKAKGRKMVDFLEMVKTKADVERYVYDLDRRKEDGYKDKIFEILEYAHENNIIDVLDYSDIICNIHYEDD